MPPLNHVLTEDECRAVRDHLNAEEGFVAWMYLDTRAVVTIGYGKALANAAAVQQVNFGRETPAGQAQPTGPVTPAEKTQQYEAVAHLAAARIASFYRSATYLRIDEAEGSRLREDHLEEDMTQLLNIYGNQRFRTFPLNAIIALTDMIYQLGAGGLRGYVHMNNAIRSEPPNWTAAALECGRRDASDGRNERTVDLFNRCAPGRIVDANGRPPAPGIRPGTQPAPQPGPGQPPGPGPGPGGRPVP